MLYIYVTSRVYPGDGIEVVIRTLFEDFGGVFEMWDYDKSCREWVIECPGDFERIPRRIRKAIREAWLDYLDDHRRFVAKAFSYRGAEA